jgi:hypothetical protein
VSWCTCVLQIRQRSRSSEHHRRPFGTTLSLLRAEAGRW